VSASDIPTLGKIFDALEDRFEDAGVPCTFRRDPENVERNDDFPRIVFVPTQDAFGPKDSTGQAAINPKSIGTRTAGFDVHLWGATFSATEILLNEFVRQLRVDTMGVYKLARGLWTDTTKIARRGREYVLSVTIDLPIVDVPWDVADMAELTITGDVAAIFPDDTVEGNVTVIAGGP
jgi:hypothetical protein